MAGRLPDDPPSVRPSTTRADRAIKTGAIGSIVAALCCVTPLLVVALTALGLGAVAGGLDAVLIPAFVVCVGVLAYGLYLRRKERAACCHREGPFPGDRI